MRTCKWFPKPSELITLAQEVQHEQIIALPKPAPRNRTPEEQATLLRVEALAKKHGIRLSKPTMDAIAEAGASVKGNVA